MAKEPLLYTMAVVLPLAYLLSNSLCTILGVNGVLGDCLICLTSIIITYIIASSYIVARDRVFILVHTVLIIYTSYPLYNIVAGVLQGLSQPMHLCIYLIIASTYYTLSLFTILWIRHRYFIGKPSMMIAREYSIPRVSRVDTLFIALVVAPSIITPLYYTGLLYRILYTVDKLVEPYYLEPGVFYLVLLPLSIVFVLGFYKILSLLTGFIEELFTVKTLCRDRDVKAIIKNYISMARDSRTAYHYPEAIEFRLIKILYIVFIAISVFIMNLPGSQKIIDRLVVGEVTIQEYILYYSLLDLCLSIPLIHGLLLLLHKIFIIRRGVGELYTPALFIALGLAIWFIITYVA